MADADVGRREASSPPSHDPAEERAEKLASKTEELEAFRDGGVLTEAEFEEQKAKLRWS